MATDVIRDAWTEWYNSHVAVGGEDVMPFTAFKAGFELAAAGMRTEQQDINMALKSFFDGLPFTAPEAVPLKITQLHERVAPYLAPAD